jgi:GNAT superfamily N-acetyltransferase
MMMKLDKATPADIPALTALWHAGWHQGHAAFAPTALIASRTPSEFEGRLAARLDHTVVARKEGALAGFYMLDGDEVYQFYVDAAFQGQGVAGALMAAAEVALSGRMAWLACSMGNERAARFYAKAGWQHASEQVYQAETAKGPLEVTIIRFEKDLR